MSSLGNWMRKFPSGSLSRHQFVERSALMTIAALLTSAATCHAGPCTVQIVQLEQQVAQLQANPVPSGVGEPSAPQTLGAQLHRQPTPGSVESAENAARGDGTAALERARKADAANDAGGCNSALDQAKQVYGIQ